MAFPSISKEKLKSFLDENIWFWSWWKKRDWMGVDGEADGNDNGGEHDDNSVGKAWFIDFKKM